MDGLIVNIANFLLLIFCVGIVGWFSWHLLFSFSSSEDLCTPGSGRLSELFLIFISGVASSSAFLLVVGLAGIFKPWVLILYPALLALCHVTRCRIRKAWDSFEKLLRYALFLLALTGAGLAFFMGLQPYEAASHAVDAPLFIGAAHYIPQYEGVRYEDRLAAQMTCEERTLFFEGVCYGGQEEPLIRERHGGGVMLFEGEPPRSAIGFFPLFPLWLALGTVVAGPHGFLCIMSLLAVLNLCVLYALGRALGNRILGLGLCLMMIFFFPQIHYLRLPLSETLLQFFVLSGLLLFVQALKNSGKADTRQQLLISVLWGCAFFCKFEMLFLLPLCLGAAFVFIPRLRRELILWRGLVIALTLFYILAILYQYHSGVFLLQIRNWSRSIPALRAILGFLEQNPMQRGGLFLCLWIAVVFLFRSEGRLWTGLRKTALVLTASMIVLALGTFCYLRFAPYKVSGVWQWQTFYAEPWVWIFIASGLLLHLINGIIKPVAAHWVVVLFLIVPGLIYFVDPMVHGFHPFAIRRFVPLFYPTLFLLSLHGWSMLGSRFLRTRPAWTHALCLVPALVCIVPFSQTTWRFNEERLYKGHISQLRKIAEPLPANSLVLMPESLSRQALHIPMQYLNRFDTLVLPEIPNEAKKKRDLLLSFLWKRMEKQKVLLMLSSESAVPGFLNLHFSLRRIHSAPLSLHLLRELDRFDSRPHLLEEEIHIFELGPGKEFFGRCAVDIGTPSEDLPFLIHGFYRPEQTRVRSFRWTSERAVLKLPPAREVRILASLDQPGTPICRDLRIRVHGQDIPLETPMVQMLQWIAFRVPPDLRHGDDPMWVEIMPSTFEGGAGAGNRRDARRLGIRIYKVEWTY